MRTDEAIILPDKGWVFATRQTQWHTPQVNDAPRRIVIMLQSRCASKTAVLLQRTLCPHDQLVYFMPGYKMNKNIELSTLEDLYSKEWSTSVTLSYVRHTQNLSFFWGCHVVKEKQIFVIQIFAE